MYLLYIYFSDGGSVRYKSKDYIYLLELQKKFIEEKKSEIVKTIIKKLSA